MASDSLSSHLEILQGKILIVNTRIQHSFKMSAWYVANGDDENTARDFILLDRGYTKKEYLGATRSVAVSCIAKV